MKRIIKILFVCFLCMLCFSVGCMGTSIIEEKEKSIDYKKVEKYIPKQTQELIKESKINKLTVDDIAQIINFDSVLNVITLGLFNAIKKQSVALLNIIAVLVMMQLAKGLKSGIGDDKNAEIFNICCILCIVAVIYKPVFDCVYNITNTVNQCEVFLKGLMPITATLMVTSGAPASAAVGSTFVLAAVNLVSMICTNAIIPFVNLYIASGVGSSLGNNVKLEGFTSVIKSVLTWFITIISVTFIGILSLQNIISMASDTMTKRTVKYAIRSFMPTIGGMVSETLDTVLASLNVIKGSVGIFGVAVLIFTLLPPFLELVVLFFMLKFASAFSELFENESSKKIFMCIADAFKLLMIVYIACSLMLIFSLSVSVLGQKG